MDELRAFKESLMKSFEMTDLGLMQYFLGLEVRQELNSITVCQTKYAEDLLKRFGMHNSRSYPTPLNVREKFQFGDSSGKADEEKYHCMIGGLLYHTRPNLMFAVSLASRYLHHPSKHHMGAVERVLHYVSGSVNFGIKYKHVENFKLEGYVDCDSTGCVDDR
ncbi:uncharacterized mitochondrial protein AtMg00810-like [Dioscorea cayenensis subsp. rotundata]|uniref:Uncharacterized mitochondrial protein AtMg00810-like n=1 Tax=Dioscorea cayennensis subsp. rotundata TaxID=55577 RepID=A0AB40AVU6_DIOCR|nr:uncharacterized mitochondrial protein AtMg00810-like [Dioscorea cayenensis subsp. rotundata]